MKLRNNLTASEQKGIAPILLILLAAAGLIAYLLVSSSAEFRDKLFSQLFPKTPSEAQQPMLSQMKYFLSLNQV